MDYEQWTRAEISRLRTIATMASSDADALQRSFDKWLESQGRRAATPELKENDLNGHAQRRGKRAGYGDKNATALQKIKEASPNGLTTDELYDVFVEVFGPKYKRSSMRALLWNQKKNGYIDLRNGRYVTMESGHGG